MARRRFATPYEMEPASGLANWARRIAIFSAVACVVSIIIVRFGFLEVRPALATFLGALGCALLSILVALIGFAAIWHNGSRGMGRILFALLLDALILVYPAYLVYQYRTLPALYDITTDPIDPPKFEALARLRNGEGANNAAYAGLYSAEQQRRAYPDIETVQLDVSVQRAYDIVLNLIHRRKWLVVDARAPQPPKNEGKIEAVARTPIMGFREDVAVRVLPDGDGSRIDLRSASRYFENDLGSNAARITALIEDINDATDNDQSPPQRKAPAATVTAKPQVKGAPRR